MAVSRAQRTSAPDELYASTEAIRCVPIDPAPRPAVSSPAQRALVRLGQISRQRARARVALRRKDRVVQVTRKRAPSPGQAKAVPRREELLRTTAGVARTARTNPDRAARALQPLTAPTTRPKAHAPAGLAHCAAARAAIRSTSRIQRRPGAPSRRHYGAPCVPAYFPGTQPSARPGFTARLVALRRPSL